MLELAWSAEQRDHGDQQAAENAELLTALRERQILLGRLSCIQRAITGRAPLHDVLAAIVAGAGELIPGTTIGFRRVQPEDADSTTLVVGHAGRPGALPLVGDRIEVGSGVAGLVVTEDRLVVVHDYADSPLALRSRIDRGLQAAMGAPVHEDGLPVGALVAASVEPGRRFTTAEQDVLLAFADQASLAVTDAHTVETLRRALEDARHDAMHDVLTGLPNRALLSDRLSQAWVRASRDHSLIALLFLDLDGFKHVNDSLGHDVGDRLLAAVAARLGRELRGADTVARLGGDEFAVLIDDVQSVEQVHEVAERLLCSLNEAIMVDDREVTVGASIGIALSEADESDPRTLLRNADLAMYAAKRSGGGRHVRYEPDMHRRTVGRMDLEQALRRGVRHEELVLHYQPIRDIISGRVLAVEALVRWQHPTRGLVSPAEFIPVAESSRLIIELGEWVLREACQQAACWPSDIQISVNVSPVQIERCLLGTIRGVLADSGLRADRLTLEVTERVAMADSPETLSVIEELHATGMRFAIDDFGSGYSSLARLRQLPVDQIKIDRGFITDNDPADAVLLSAIVTLARAAGLVAVAEGVETHAQLRQLRELGCHQAQGFLLGRPVTATALTAVLAQPAVPAPRAIQAVNAVASA